MRRTLLGVVIALGFAGLAHASDYIVVNSTDASFKKGQALDAGARISLPPGKTVTLMRASGEISTLRGSAAGVMVPGMRLADADAARFDALRALVAPPPEGRTFGARRGGICPAPENLTTMDDIVRAAQTGCKTQARQALDAYIAHGE